MADETQNGFIEPKSVAEALKRRGDLQTELSEIQLQLSARRPPARINSADYRDYLAWKLKARAAFEYKAIEKRNLTRWLGTHEDSTRRAHERFGDPQNIKQQAKRAVQELGKYTFSLEQMVNELTVENQQLRARVAELEHPAPVAPGDGVDEWREIDH